MTERPLPRDLLPAGVEGAKARALWAFAHGMTIRELNERFPPDADLDAAWARGLAAFGATS